MRKLCLPLAGLFGVSPIVSLLVWFAAGSGQGDLDWDIRCKNTVMTFAYKAYANPSAAAGKYYLSKTVLTNTGDGPVRDISISYQVPGYISWTTPERYAELLPGQTLVDLFYPKLPQKVAELTSRTTTTLEIRLTYDDGEGPEERIEKRDFDLRGVNEIEYTSMAASEIVSWYDMFENTDLVAAFVTTDDPVVKAFAGEITKFAGGTTAGAGGGTSEVVRLMNAFYNYQVATGMHYASAKGVPEKLGDINSLVQNVRLPREVILNGNGLCIELAILWSAVMEHLGVKTYLVVIPGHAFTVVQDTNGQIVPIECTGIGGAGLGGASSFEDAVKSASQTLNKAQVVKYLDIQQLQANGIRPPELARVDPKTVREALEARAGKKDSSSQTIVLVDNSQTTNVAPTPQPVPVPTPAPAPVVAAGFQSWSKGPVSLQYPSNWQPNALVMQQIQPFAPWLVLMTADAVSGAGVEVYHWRGTNDLEEAAEEIEELMDALGAEMDISSIKRTKVGRYAAIETMGTTMSAAGSTRWVTIFTQSSQGVVGVSVGCNSLTYETQVGTLSKVLASVTVR